MSCQVRALTVVPLRLGSTDTFALPSLHFVGGHLLTEIVRNHGSGMHKHTVTTKQLFFSILLLVTNHASLPPMLSGGKRSARIIGTRLAGCRGCDGTAHDAGQNGVRLNCRWFPACFPPFMISDRVSVLARPYRLSWFSWWRAQSRAHCAIICTSVSTSSCILIAAPIGYRMHAVAVGFLKLKSPSSRSFPKHGVHSLRGGKKVKFRVSMLGDVFITRVNAVF